MFVDPQGLGPRLLEPALGSVHAVFHHMTPRIPNYTSRSAKFVECWADSRLR